MTGFSFVSYTRVNRRDELVNNSPLHNSHLVRPDSRLAVLPVAIVVRILTFGLVGYGTSELFLPRSMASVGKRRRFYTPEEVSAHNSRKVRAAAV